MPPADAPIRLAEQRMARARLRRAGRPSLTPHPSGHIFRVAVGVTGDPVEAGWSAFDERYQWFGKEPKSVASGAHLFILAVDRWRSAVVGLYETVSPGAARLPDSPDPGRWPWALGVRPLAAIPPPEARQVPGQRGPQSGLPERIYDEAVWPQMYAAVAASPPPPGPTTLEQRVQELEPADVSDDVLAAVRDLGRRAFHADVVERAVELGGWTERELAARAWYTGSGSDSHVRNIVDKALMREHVLTRRLVRRHGNSPYEFRDGGAGAPPPPGFGVAYRPAEQQGASAPDDAPHQVDLSALDAATARHMRLQDDLAAALTARGVQPRSPGSWQPAFDLAFEHGGERYVVEVKSGDPVRPQQVRLGAGQVLEYAHLLGSDGRRVRPVLLLEGEPPAPWPALLAGDLAIGVLRSDRLAASLDELLAEPA